MERRREWVFEFADESDDWLDRQIHRRQGNIVLGDGSVQQLSDPRLREYLGVYPEWTTRVALPISQ